MILLDTDIWVRYLAPAARPLPAKALAAIAAADGLAISAISCWEVVTLQRRGRIELTLNIDRWLDMALAGSGIKCIAITGDIGSRAAALTNIHRDPADRFIIATAVVTRLPLLTLDEAIQQYPEMSDLLV